MYHRPDERGHEPEEDAGVAEGGVHRGGPDRHGAARRSPAWSRWAPSPGRGWAATYCDVCFTMIWSDTKVLAGEVADHDDRDVGLEELRAGCPC